MKSHTSDATTEKPSTESMYSVSVSSDASMEQVKTDEASKRRRSSGFATRMTGGRAMRNPATRQDDSGDLASLSSGAEAVQTENNSMLEEKTRITSRKSRGGMERLAPATGFQRSAAAAAAPTTSMRSMRSIPSKPSINSGQGLPASDLLSAGGKGGRASLRSMRTANSNGSMCSVGSMRPALSLGLGGVDLQESSTSPSSEHDADAASKIRAMPSRRLSDAGIPQADPLVERRHSMFQDRKELNKTSTSPYPLMGFRASTRVSEGQRLAFLEELEDYSNNTNHGKDGNELIGMKTGSLSDAKARLDEAVIDKQQNRKKFVSPEGDFEPGAYRILVEKDDSSLVREAGLKLREEDRSSNHNSSTDVVEISAELVDADEEKRRATELQELRDKLAMREFALDVDGGINLEDAGIVEATKLDLDALASPVSKRVMLLCGCLIALVAAVAGVIVTTSTTVLPGTPAPSASPTATPFPLSCFMDSSELFAAVDLVLDPLASPEALQELLLIRGATMEDWCVAPVEDFSFLFGIERNPNAASFNESISMWDTSNARNMKGMFSGAEIFNADLSLWDMSNVVDASNMFSGSKAFNSNLSSWNVSACEDMSVMFEEAITFNHDISMWDTSRVKSMERMFHMAIAFNQDISRWNTSQVTTMATMFREALVFDAEIGAWDVSEVATMAEMFSFALTFNQDISAWQVGQVKDMRQMFQEAILFDQDISQWDVSQVVDMQAMFMFAPAFSQDLHSWDVSSLLLLKDTFLGASSFRGNVSAWDVSNVLDFDSVFDGCFEFDSDLSGWDVSEAISLRWMLSGTKVTSDLSGWNVSKVVDLAHMFEKCESFNSDISMWDVSQVADMSNMFAGATAFNQPLSRWNVTSVTQMDLMFSGATAFSQDLSSWDVSSVEDMSSMFSDSSFNGDITSWVVTNVEDMSSMFENNRRFNQPIVDWNVSNVEDFDTMFGGAMAFDQDISGWNVINGQDFVGMFSGAVSFRQNLCPWGALMMTTDDEPSVQDMFVSTACPTFEEPVLEGSFVNPICFECV